MENLTIKQIDEVRKTGFRPSVVCCCINDKKVLMAHKREYSLWMLPQGGVQNGETLDQAVARALTSEMGATFAAECVGDITILGEDQVEFLPEKQGLEDMHTDDGTMVKMLGKKYYFCAIKCETENVTLSETSFDDSHWFEYTPGLFIAKKMPQAGKRRTTSNAFNLMKEAGLIE